MFNDPLAAALSKIFNAEKVGHREVQITPASRLIRQVLGIFQDHKYVGGFEIQEEGKGNSLKLSLLGNINHCGVIKPRFSTKCTGYERWEKRYLPAKDFGIILVSTPQGIMTHLQAKQKGLGGKLLVYCY